MQLILILISVFVFLYILHYYVRDDFVIFRKNVSLEDIFNSAFLSFLFVFLFSRLFYIADNPSSVYLNPLVFLAFFYYPGLSLAGGIAGGLIFLATHLRRKKFPAKRILDFFSIAAIWSVATYSILDILLFRKFTTHFLLEAGIFGAFLVLYIFFLVPRYLAGKIKDGFLTGIFLVGFSAVKLTVFLSQSLSFKDKTFQSILLLILLISGIIYIFREGLVPRIKDLK